LELFIHTRAKQTIENKERFLRVLGPIFFMGKAFDIKLPNGMNITENRLYEAMKKLGLNPTPQYEISDMTVDFAFPEHNLVIEVNGPHHEEEQQREIDRKRYFVLKDFGWDVRNFKAEHAYNYPKWVARKIKEMIDPEEKPKSIAKPKPAKPKSVEYSAPNPGIVSRPAKYKCVECGIPNYRRGVCYICDHKKHIKEKEEKKKKLKAIERKKKIRKIIIIVSLILLVLILSKVLYDLNKKDIPTNEEFNTIPNGQVINPPDEDVVVTNLDKISEPTEGEIFLEKVKTNEIYHELFRELEIGLIHEEVVDLVSQNNLEWSDRGGEAGSEMYRIIIYYNNVNDEDWIIVTYENEFVSSAELNINSMRVESLS
jgi:very-short-patch-repair endonuclease